LTRYEAPWYHWDGPDLVLTVRVQPRASRDEIVGPQGGHLKVRITAPPVDGKANAHLIKFLAKAFGVTRSRIDLLSGETGREKRVRIAKPATLPQEAAIYPPDCPK
jgi:uncharacterized protein (TIGR00251 family)